LLLLLVAEGESYCNGFRAASVFERTPPGDEIVVVSNTGLQARSAHIVEFATSEPESRIEPLTYS